MESKRLDNAALAAGISPNYINAHGKPQSISAETKRRLLDAMHPNAYRHESGGNASPECHGLYQRQKNADGGGGQRRI
ncbi:4-alpha-glucanotransferase [Escherichia coli]